MLIKNPINSCWQISNNYCQSCKFIEFKRQLGHGNKSCYSTRNSILFLSITTSNYDHALEHTVWTCNSSQIHSQIPAFNTPPEPPHAVYFKVPMNGAFNKILYIILKVIPIPSNGAISTSDTCQAMV